MGADRRRPAWETLSAAMRERIITGIGGAYVSDAPAHGGFGAGYAGIVTTTRRRVFVKACPADGHLDSLAYLRHEIAALAGMPAEMVPETQFIIDDEHGAALVLAAIDGEHPGEPWSDHDLHIIAERVRMLSEARAPRHLPPADEAMIPKYARWRAIAEDERISAGLSPELVDRLPLLFELEDALPEAVRGDRIIHNDLRADNILVARGRAHFLDWPHARRGAAWVDLPCFLPSVEAGGGPRCEQAWQIFEDHGAPSPQSLLPVIAGIASLFWFGQAQPEIPELPGLRAFQRAQAAPALRWLTALL